MKINSSGLNNVNEPWYDTAQICMNGHVVTSSLNKTPEWGRQSCIHCGASTISKCQNCDTDIKGTYHIPGVLDIRRYERPNFCHDCSKPYPWTREKIKAALKLISELDKLDDEKRKLLKEDLGNIMNDTPQTTAAANRFKKSVAKTGRNITRTFEDILADIVSDTARKIIWPS